MKHLTTLIRVFLRRHWLTVAFIAGFIVDNLTLNRVDQLLDNVILFSYVLLAMVSMVLLYASVAGKISEQIAPPVRRYSPLVLQYSFGGLLSGMLIFYGRSGTLYDSWPFLLLILGVIYGNETIRDRAERLIFNLTIFFVGLFSYVVLALPVFTGKMGPGIFLASGAVAVFIMYWFVRLLELVVPNFLALQRRKLVFVIGLVYAFLNLLYFTNVIPPIPLSLKDIGIYHSVVRYGDGSYRLTYEKPRWYEFVRDSDSTFHYQQGDNIYCFARVFAPARIASLKIYHRWEYYDASLGEWILHGRYAYDIEGGRGDGFRGYTLIRNYREGKWRCVAETERGQVIGRETFTVSSESRDELVTRVE